MSDLTPRLTPRSVGAVADFELLRVARTDLDEPERRASLSLAERIRGLAVFRVTRTSDRDDSEVVRLDQPPR